MRALKISVVQFRYTTIKRSIFCDYSISLLAHCLPKVHILIVCHGIDVTRTSQVIVLLGTIFSCTPTLGSITFLTMSKVYVFCNQILEFVLLP